ncbi:hypothetical protein COU57_01665 [Candidatus Pacearchaeota archaeon CG10_big_fil_rev_8_21_14_0_10_32_14]|nr:MAG: hypothetical protein COU57_01665 [Candidatus Pacearchaeota archaeon CG10_big_fil_rev_8_21_14_0_10_32_14]
MTSLADLTTFYVTLPADFKNYLEAEGMFPEDVMKKTQLKEEDVQFLYSLYENHPINMRLLCQDKFKECDLCRKCQEGCTKVKQYLDLVFDKK